MPILIHNWLKFRRFHDRFQVDIQGPVLSHGRATLTAGHAPEKKRGVEYFVGLAGKRNPDAILILLDADDDCPAALGASLIGRARLVVPTGFPIGVVVANREFEAWFLAAFASAGFRRKVVEAEGPSLSLRSIPRGFDVEQPRDCKGRIAEWIGVERYEPTVHQAKLTAHLPFKGGIVAGRSRSFRKLLKELESLTAAARRARRGR